MAVRTPEDLYKQIAALTPDPATGKPNGDKVKAFFAAHPETAAFIAWKEGYKPSTSFSTEKYHSINAFYLIDATGERHAVRWVMVPQATAQLMTSDVSQADPNILQMELAARLKAELQYVLT